MRFLLDENLSFRICEHLRTAGHEVAHVNDLGLAGATDDAVLAAARDQERVLVSCDHDFVHLLFASGDMGPSLILTRDVDTLPAARIAALLVAALSDELRDLLDAGAIATLTLDRVRVRPLPLRPGKRT